MTVLHNINSTFGAIQISSPQPIILIAKPSGYISPRMIKEDFDFVSNYEEEGFEYYVDLTDFVLPNPMNLIYLRKLNAIPRLRHYKIVTDNPILKLFIIPLKGLLKYHQLIGSVEFRKSIER